MNDEDLSLTSAESAPPERTAEAALRPRREKAARQDRRVGVEDPVPASSAGSTRHAVQASASSARPHTVTGRTPP